MIKDGIILINKEQNWTSFDVVAKIKSLIKSKKVGHGGTLDPMATGLLPVFIGKATKKVIHFSNANKGYRGELILGIKTDTQDIWGKRIYTHEEKFNISQKKLKELIGKYTGEIHQIPPMYSAKKKNGIPLYKLARKGIKVERELKKVHIYDLKFTEVFEGPSSKIKFEVICSKGTYIRSLVSDIGDDLGCGACLGYLERFYFHPFVLSQAFDIQTIVDLSKIGKLNSVILNVEDFTST